MVFAAGPASIHNHFNLDRHLNRRDTSKQKHAILLGSRIELSKY